jgi:uncharacterized protein DUF4145
MIPYNPPEFEANAFNCPHCNAFANHIWHSIRRFLPSGNWDVGELKLAACTHCSKYSLWHFKEMSYPDASGITPPNEDLRDDIKEDYDEARKIVNKSPRGATALLRLAIQKLCEQLGEGGKNINNDIANLVKKGLPHQIQQALDIVRVVGNNAVHPGQIDLKDDRDTALKLFALINLIADVMITQPKHVQEFYDSLPQSAKDAIQKRDSGT